MIDMTDTERRHCRDLFAQGRRGGSELASFGIDPAKKAAFDAAADRENFLQKPILSERPKNGCKPFVEHQQYATLGASRDAVSLSLGCGKTF